MTEAEVPMVDRSLTPKCARCATDISDLPPRTKFCKACIRERRYARTKAWKARQLAENTEWARKNRERNREYSKARYASDPEVRKYQKEWNDRNKDLKARHQRERRKDPEVVAREREYAKEYNRRPEVKERQRKWRDNDGRREYERNWKRNKYNSDPEFRRKVMETNRARKPWDETVTPDAVRAMLESQNGRCNMCGKSIADSYHMDHIFPRSKGGPSTLSNLQLLCPKCNCAKQDKVI